jgi:site-specific DNA recombinase
LQEAEIPLADIQLVLKAVEARAATLESLPQGALTVAELVERVDLRKDGVAISINLHSLLPAGSVVRQRPALTFTEFVPLRMKRRGIAMRLVIGGRVSTGTADLTLLKAVARGRKWFNELASGRAKFTQEIAAREGVNGRFVRRLIPLAFLSPAIVQAIVEAGQPDGGGIEPGHQYPRRVG